MLRTVGLVPGVEVSGDDASPLPGAKFGRGGVMTPFHGHIVSFSRRPSRLCGVYVLTLSGFVRRFSHCHNAQRRSTLACSMKNSGSFGAVGIDDTQPLNETCAAPCGVPSMPLNAA